MSAPASLAILLLTAVQSTDAVIDQVNVSAKTQSSTTEQITAPIKKAAAAQIGTTTREVPAAPVSKRSSASNQLMVTKPSAAAPASGSTPQQGRNTTTEAVKGADRCDPANGKAAGDACTQVIETRSADFPPPEPEPLTPEQNLLISQQARADTATDVNSATRRLANGDVDASNVGGAVSSLVTTPSPEETVPQPQKDQATEAIISTVMGVIQSGQQ